MMNAKRLESSTKVSSSRKTLVAFLVLVAISFCQNVSSFQVKARKPPPGKLHSQRASVSASDDLPRAAELNRNKIANAQNQNKSSLGSVWQRYVDLLEEKPIRTKSITAAVIGGMGSVLSQYITARTKHEVFFLNKGIVLAFMLTNFFFVGPLQHGEYELLWKLGAYMKRKFGATKGQQVVTQIFLDQTVGACVFFPLYFLFYEIFEALVFGRTPMLSMAQEKCSQQLLPILFANWKLWPAANFINFRFVPPALRNLFACVLGVFWSAFLCFKMA